MTDYISPFDTVEIGSTALAETGSFGFSVIGQGLTRFNSSWVRHDLITASSAYLHQSSTDEASMAVSGSYGVSGISKVSSGLSAYVGRSKSDESRKLSITMTSLLAAGIEFVDFDNLLLEDFIGGLALKVQQDLGNVLAKYNAAVNAGGNHVDKSGNPTKGLLETPEFAEWVKEKERFFAQHGNAVVVGVVWGGYGDVRLTFSEVTDDVMWKAGGKAKFSYAGTGASVQVDSAYGHTQLSQEQKKSGQVERHSSGRCVEATITAWEAELNKTLQDETKDIGQTKLQDLSGNAAPVSDPPNLIEPKKPKDDSIVSKIKEIKNLDALKAFAKASAYDAYKKKAGDNAKTLDEFLSEAEEKNPIDALPSGPISPLDGGVKGEAGVSLEAPAGGLRPESAEKDEASPAKIKDQGYTALGAWMVEWGQLFPWLVTAQDNSVSASSNNPEAQSQIRGLIKLRTFRSDLMALSRIYSRLNAEGVKIKNLNLDFRDISNSFQSAATNALRLMQAHLSKLGGSYSPAELDKQLNSAVENLGVYKTIYKTWCDNPVLRDAELGFGLWILKMSSGWSAQGVRGLEDKGDWASFKYGPSSFEPHLEKPYFATFAPDAKAWPVILPDGKILMFVSDGTLKTSGLIVASDDAPGGGGCHLFKDRTEGASENNSFGYPHSNHFNALVFRQYENKPDYYPTHALHANSVEKLGRYDDAKRCEIFAFPIPFEAADGIDWAGASPTPGLDDMKAQLQQLHDTLGGLKRWSFESDHWTDVEWGEKPIKGLQSLDPMYVGLIPEPSGVFFHPSRKG